MSSLVPGFQWLIFQINSLSKIQLLLSFTRRVIRWSLFVARCAPKSNHCFLTPLCRVSISYRFVFSFCFLLSSICLFLLTELNEVLDRLTLVQSQPVGSGRVETTDTSGDETGGEAGNVSGPPRRSKKTFKLKRSHAQGEVGSFFVTGSTDAAAKPSHFYCRVCRKDISISAKGSYEILRHYQGSRHYLAIVV